MIQNYLKTNECQEQFIEFELTNFENVNHACEVFNDIIHNIT